MRLKPEHKRFMTIFWKDLRSIVPKGRFRRFSVEGIQNPVSRLFLPILREKQKSVFEQIADDFTISLQGSGRLTEIIKERSERWSRDFQNDAESGNTVPYELHFTSVDWSSLDLVFGDINRPGIAVPSHSLHLQLPAQSPSSKDWVRSLCLVLILLPIQNLTSIASSAWGKNMAIR